MEGNMKVNFTPGAAVRMRDGRIVFISTYRKSWDWKIPGYLGEGWLHLANLVPTPTQTENGAVEKWHIISLTSRRTNGRGRYDQPEDAIKAYYGRKAMVKR
jgi:hypothetical protein